MFQYCTCPAGRVTNNFHSSCNHMHLSFKSVCNKEHKGVICNSTSSFSSQSTRPTGRVLGNYYSSFLDFTRNYELTSGIFVPCMLFDIERELFLLQLSRENSVLASLSHRPGYQQITKIPCLDFLKQVHVLLTCYIILDVMNEQFIVC